MRTISFLSALVSRVAVRSGMEATVENRGRGRLRRSVVLLSAGIVIFAAAVAWAIVTDLTTVAIVHSPLAEHADQAALNALPRDVAFEEAFELGDELFGTAFNALDGVGGNVGHGQRFSHIPRADLKGPGEWFNHTPARVTGPNAQGCFECHEQPFEDGAGGAVTNVHRDTFRTGNISQFVERNTPHTFAPGAIQRLAEEMTDGLSADLAGLVAETCRFGGTRTTNLTTKGVNFGTLSATRTQPSPCTTTFNTDGVRGIDFLPSVDNPSAGPQLIVRPFQWKGSQSFLRDFNRGAAHNEIGMQAVEIVGRDVDGDFDGVKNELTIGDMTVLAVYMAAQPRPSTLLEVNALGLLEPALTNTQIATINRGHTVFQEVGCASCHIPSLTIDVPIFSEPSQNPAYRDGDFFPVGLSTAAEGVTAGRAIKFDLTKDQPDNIIRNANGSVRFRLGSLRKDNSGRALVELYGDLKRHVMGPRLAEAVNEIAGDDVTPIPTDPRNRHTPDTFLTENLWGVGSTAPYMHDGRATTLTEAILEHGNGAANDTSEGRFARANFLGRSNADKRALVAFLANLILFKVPEAVGEATATTQTGQLSTTQQPSRRRQAKPIVPSGFQLRTP